MTEEKRPPGTPTVTLDTPYDTTAFCDALEDTRDGFADAKAGVEAANDALADLPIELEASVDLELVRTDDGGD